MKREVKWTKDEAALVLLILEAQFDPDKAAATIDAWRDPTLVRAIRKLKQATKRHTEEQVG